MSDTSAITRLTLVPTAPRERGAHEPKIRRYRLATVRAPASPEPGARFAHLKRAYD
ncbi:hypothetical protein NBH00_16485 [Paraconexibacter antarcticus]|uniref:J domain-containing protein n=1 Tax=Paraconexibacter antarcticus TaxID=2949664 RepID=A0ABY5DND1_9ACTN|nr:hypothetical protein [Paraconexibacter antarcticus]UTI62950.1 hypothetical protein NBH00_16485 [Paraconexibacter antarcticus]